MGDDIDKRVQDLVLACLAKKPNQRPGSAMDLSNRAKALRLQLEGVAPTEVFDADQTPTSVAPRVESDPKTEPAEKLPVIWPWLVLIGALFVAAAGVMIAIVLSLLSESELGESPNPTFDPSFAPTETITEAPRQTVVVLLTDVIGKNVADASIFLKERGLLVDAVPGEPLDPADPRILTVYKAEGLGQVPIGSTIRIFYYIQQTVVPGPTVTEPGTSPTPTDSSSPVPIPVPSFSVTPIPTSSPTPSASPTNGDG